MNSQDIEKDLVVKRYLGFGARSSCACSKARGYATNLESKLNVSDYFCDLPVGCNASDFVEVQFKNTRKGYFLNSLKLDLHKGDIVAVEAMPGHDIGEVTLTGKLVELQMQKTRYRHPNGEPRRVYRIAKPADLEKYEQVKQLEHPTMIESRKIAESLGLDMKIGDVEYQGDGQKAIFYYIAEGRVDFRQLIRRLAEAFHIRVEMKQIGARQEAGRIGGLGPCGRQLCCSSWMTSFVSVGTNAARLQDLSLNPQKLAGQCAKLKCCLNYEVDTYYEAQQQMPHRSIELRTSVGDYRYMKADILAGEITYLPKVRDRREISEPITITRDRALEIIQQNKQGMIPFNLQFDSEEMIDLPAKVPNDLLSQSSMNRFDEERKGNRRKKKQRNGNNNSANNNKGKQTDPVQNSPDAHNEELKRAAREGASRRRRRPNTAEGAGGEERTRRRTNPRRNRKGGERSEE